MTEEEINKYKENVLKVLETDGEGDKIRNIITKKIYESNWTTDIKRMSSKRIDQESIEELTPESVTQLILEEAIDAFPENLVNLIISDITEFLTKKMIPAESVPQ